MSGQEWTTKGGGTLDFLGIRNLNNPTPELIDDESVLFLATSLNNTPQKLQEKLSELKTMDNDWATLGNSFEQYTSAIAEKLQRIQEGQECPPLTEEEFHFLLNYDELCKEYSSLSDQKMQKARQVHDVVFDNIYSLEQTITTNRKEVESCGERIKHCRQLQGTSNDNSRSQNSGNIPQPSHVSHSGLMNMPQQNSSQLSQGHTTMNNPHDILSNTAMHHNVGGMINPTGSFAHPGGGMVGHMGMSNNTGPFMNNNNIMMNPGHHPVTGGQFNAGNMHPNNPHMNNNNGVLHSSNNRSNNALGVSGSAVNSHVGGNNNTSVGLLEEAVGLTPEMETSGNSGGTLTNMGSETPVVHQKSPMLSAINPGTAASMTTNGSPILVNHGSTASTGSVSGGSSMTPHSNGMNNNVINNHVNNNNSASLGVPIGMSMGGISTNGININDMNPMGINMGGVVGMHSGMNMINSNNNSANPIGLSHGMQLGNNVMMHGGISNGVIGMPAEMNMNLSKGSSLGGMAHMGMHMGYANTNVNMSNLHLNNHVNHNIGTMNPPMGMHMNPGMGHMTMANGNGLTTSLEQIPGNNQAGANNRYLY